MALVKVTYVDGTTVIYAANLNAIQDAIIALENALPQSAVQYVAQSLTDAQKAQARDNIGAASIEDLGTVFDIKGDVATVADLPATGNRVGDVYYVQAVQAAYVWIETTAHPSGYWEEFGEPIDLSGYIEKPSSAQNGDFLCYNSTSGKWEATTVPSAQGVNF